MKKKVEDSISKMQKEYKEWGLDPYNICCHLTTDGTIYEKASRALSSLSRMFGIPPEKAFAKYYNKIFLNNIKSAIVDITHYSGPKAIKLEENIPLDYAKALSIIGRIEPASKEDIIKEIKKRIGTIKKAEEIFESLERENQIFHDTQNKYRRVM